MGYFVVAPRLFNEPPSQWLLFEPDGIRIYGLGAEPEYSGPNEGLVVECAPGAVSYTHLTLPTIYSV